MDTFLDALLEGMKRPCPEYILGYRCAGRFGHAGVCEMTWADARRLAERIKPTLQENQRTSVQDEVMRDWQERSERYHRETL